MKNIAGKNAMKMKECIDFTGFSRSTIQKLIALTKKNKQKQEIKLLKEAHKREQKAFAYAFLDKANLLSPSSGEPQNKDPGFSLHDIIKAAQQLDPIVFPQNMIKEPPQKQLQMGI